MSTNTKEYLESVLTGELTSHTHAGGAGDMTKAVYDSDGDGIIGAAQLELSSRAGTTHVHVTTDITGTAVATNDARLSDSRTPLAHTHISTEITGTAVLTADIRLSDARTPLSHVHVSTDITGTAVLTADSRLSDARTPISHDNTKHSATYITASGVTYEALDANSDVGTASAQLAIGNHTHPGGSEAFPIGAVFIAVVSTNPSTLLGYGTWSAFGAGKVLVGLDSGDTDFDTAEEIGGAKTIQSSAQTFGGDALASHQHDGISAGTPSGTINAHTAGRKGGTTNPQDIFNAPSTHTFTGSAMASHQHLGITAGTPTGTNTPGAATSVVQPYIVCYFWKRTA